MCLLLINHVEGFENSLNEKKIIWVFGLTTTIPAPLIGLIRLNIVNAVNAS